MSSASIKGDLTGGRAGGSEIDENSNEGFFGRIQEGTLDWDEPEDDRPALAEPGRLGEGSSTVCFSAIGGMPGDSCLPFDVVEGVGCCGDLDLESV